MFEQGDCETGEDMIGEGLLSSNGLQTSLRTCNNEENPILYKNETRVD